LKNFLKKKTHSKRNPIVSAVHWRDSHKKHKTNLQKALLQLVNRASVQEKTLLKIKEILSLLDGFKMP
jgi:hypothetical protein